MICVMFGAKVDGRACSPMLLREYERVRASKGSTPMPTSGSDLVRRWIRCDSRRKSGNRIETTGQKMNGQKREQV